MDHYSDRFDSWLLFDEVDEHVTVQVVLNSEINLR
jgi:hypothetical protein